MGSPMKSGQLILYFCTASSCRARLAIITAGSPTIIFWYTLTLPWCPWDVPILAVFGPFWPTFVPKRATLSPQGQFQPFCNWTTKYTSQEVNVVSSRHTVPAKIQHWLLWVGVGRFSQQWSDFSGVKGAELLSKKPLFKRALSHARGKNFNRSMWESLSLQANGGVVTLRATCLDSKYSGKTSGHPSPRLSRRTQSFLVSE